MDKSYHLIKMRDHSLILIFSAENQLIKG